MNRRQFLTAGALATVGTTAGLAVERSQRLRTPDKPWNASSGRALHKFRDALPTACTGCEANCAVLAYRDGDRVVQLGPNPEAKELSAPCVRAYQNLEALYDPERILRPRRRKGHRGGGEWEEISWAEAIGLLTKALASDPGSAYVDLGRPDPLAADILGTLGVERRIVETADRRWSARAAEKAVYGAPLAQPDYSKARTILFLGARPLDDGPLGPSTRALAAAKSGGTVIVSVDAYQGATGSFADEWIPIRPGTELLVALGLLREALAAGGRAPEHLAAYTPEFVQTNAGIPAARLVRLARRLVSQGPSLVVADSAGSRQADGLAAAVAQLNGLGGNPEAAGLRLERRPGFAAEATLPRSAALRDLLAGTRKASVYFAYRTNPVYAGPESELLRKAFADEGKIGFLVAMDTQLTETASLADLVLPAATDLELWNLLTSQGTDGAAYTVLQQPATRKIPEPRLLTKPGAPVEKLFDAREAGPVGEARQLGDVLLEVLKAGQHPAAAKFPYADTGAYVRGLAGSVAGGLNFDTFSRKGIAGAGASANAKGATARAQVVAYKEPAPAGKDTFSLVLLRYPELAPAYANSRWGREIRHRNPLFMNAAVARKLGLKEGDEVTIHTQAGEGHAEVFPIQGIHPEAVALAEDFGHWAGGVAATAQKKETGERPQSPLLSRQSFLRDPLGVTVQQTAPGEVPWWSEHGPGLSAARITPFTFDESGAQAWKEIRVTVRRA